MEGLENELEFECSQPNQHDARRADQEETDRAATCGSGHTQGRDPSVERGRKSFGCGPAKRDTSSRS